MPTSVGPNTFGEQNLVFGYDLGDGINSYKGQPTTNNFGGSFRDFTGTSYSPDGEWISSEPTRFTKTYYSTLLTPIGPGGTLIEESGTAGFHHLSRYGGSSEDGLHSLSCYIYPFTSGITDFCIGMLGDGSNNIQFNLDTKAITYGGGISNRNAFIRDIPGWPGWLRVGANIEGRGGGWVGCIGYSSYTSYTGTAGGKKAYITGIQYEYKTQPTPFVGGTRSVTQGLLDFAGRSTIDLTNVSFDSNAQMIFDGTDDYASVAYSTALNTPTGATYEIMLYPQGAGEFLSRGKSDSGTDPDNPRFYIGGNGSLYFDWSITGADTYIQTPASAATLNRWNHIVGIAQPGDQLRLYVNGVQVTYSTVIRTVPTPLPNTADPLIIGGATWIPRYFTGKVGGVKLYNRALTASEITSNFNAIKSRFGI